MNMNMKSLNVFHRINALELQNLHLQVMLKSARADIESLKNAMRNQTQWLTSLQTTMTPKPKAEPTKRKLTTTEKQRIYARTYYAKKKAEKAAKATP